MDEMFKNCISLTSLNLSNFNTKKINNMNYMFYNCSNLEYINLINLNPQTNSLNDIFNYTSVNLVICTESSKIISIISDCNIINVLKIGEIIRKK